MNEITISAGSLVKSAERAAAPDERRSRKRGSVEGGKAAAEAQGRPSTALPACLVSSQTAWRFTATTGWVATSAEAVAPSSTNPGFRHTVRSLFPSTG